MSTDYETAGSPTTAYMKQYLRGIVFFLKREVKMRRLRTEVR